MNSGKDKNLKRGQAVITAVVFFLLVSMTVVLGVSRPVYREVRLSRDTLFSKESFFLAESGQEDVIFRLKNALAVSDIETLSLGSSTAETVILDESGSKTITSTATSSSLVRKLQTKLDLGQGFSFNYGVQVGEGGVHMKNTSKIQGNVFTSGPITAENSPIINGDAISAGPSGLIEDIEVLANAYSHTIRDSYVGGDAFYQIISGTSVAGTSYPGSSGQATTSLPIPDSQIEIWKADAEAGGVSTLCTITTSTTIGPNKFNCSKLLIKGSPTVTFAGHVFVDGDIEFDNTANIVISPSLGGNSVAIIAHDESDEAGGGIITLKNSVNFNGPNENYFLLVSMNNDAEANGGDTSAIDVQNSAEGDILVYAPHGKINLKNSAEIREVTAYEVEVQNSAEVIYETGLVNLLFSSGPSGGYSLNSWKEIE